MGENVEEVFESQGKKRILPDHIFLSKKKYEKLFPTVFLHKCHEIEQN